MRFVGSAIHRTHASLERIDWMFPIHRWNAILTTACHPFIDGLPPHIHVDTDDIVETSSFESSFDNAGDVVPRSGAVPKSTAGSLKLFTVVPMHGKEETGEQADGMKRGSQACRSMALEDGADGITCSFAVAARVMAA